MDEKNKITKGARVYLKTQVLRRQKEDPEFQKIVIKMMEEKKKKKELKHLTQLHQENLERAMEQIGKC